MKINVERPFDFVRVNDVVILDVFLDSEGVEVNAIEGSLKIEGGYEVQALYTAGSVFDVWLQQPTYTNKEISFVGGSTDGVFGSNLKIFSVALKVTALNPLAITPINAKAFLNNGKGTKVAISSAVQKITISDTPGETRNELSILRASDAIPPKDFTVTISKDPSMFDGKYFASFLAIDDESGVESYKVKEGGSETVVKGNTYVLRDQTLNGVISVNAIDMAGNEKVVKVYSESGLAVDDSINWKGIIIWLAIIMVVIFALRKFFKRTTAKFLVLALLIGFSLDTVGTADIAHAADIFIEVNDSEVNIGDIVTATVYVNSSNQAINNVEGLLSVDPNILEIQSVTNSGSALSLWVEQPTYTKDAVTFNGGAPNPGFIGSRGKVLTLFMKALAQGSSPVTFRTAYVRANDGLGTDVLSSALNTTVAVAPRVIPVPQIATNLPAVPQVRSSLTPVADKWYNTKTTTVSWNVPNDVTAVRTILSRFANANPNILYSPAISSRTLENLGDGVLYFHVQHQNAAGWGGVARREIKIDNTLPDAPSLTYTQLDSGLVKLSMESSDVTSGISKFEVVDEKGVTATITDIRDNSAADYIFPESYSEVQKITVRAFDAANNKSESTLDIVFPYRNVVVEEEVVAVEEPNYVYWGTLILNILSIAVPIIAIVLVIVALVYIVFRRLAQLGNERNKRINKIEKEALHMINILKENVVEDIHLFKADKSIHDTEEAEQILLKNLLQDFKNIELVITRRIKRIKKDKAASSKTEIEL